MKKKGVNFKKSGGFTPLPLSPPSLFAVWLSINHWKTTDVFHLVLWPPVNDLFPLITKVKRPHLSDCIDNKNNYMHKVG